MTNTSHKNETAASVNVNFANTALWASAFVILALIIVRAGQLPANSANAAVQADRGAYTIMTADSGKGGDTEPDEILCVIDSREQILMVYEIEDARRGGLILRDGYPLSDLFLKARR